MKKFWPTILLAAAVAGAGWLIYRFAPKGGTPASSVSASSAAVSSAASSQPASQAVPSSTAAAAADRAPSRAQNSSAAASAAEQKYEKLAKAAVGLDWNKYRLKAEKEKTLGSKTYEMFSIWGEDYSVGPMLLVDPADGKVSTWVSSDSAPIPAAEDKAFDKTPHTVTGTMEDGAMMSITVKTDDGAELTVRRVDVDTTNLKSMVIGDRIKVTYTGVIKGSDMSRAFVTKLENAK